MIEDQTIINNYLSYLENKTFPCVAARAAVASDHIQCMVADHMACPKDDKAMLQFLYNFADNYRNATTPFHSAAIIFKEPLIHSEETFDQLLWQRLQALYNLDSINYAPDSRVTTDPSSPHFSFSLKGEAFFIIGLHPASSRAARRFEYPTLAFNPHAQFEQLRETGQYQKMQDIVRKRDLAYSGSVNPMLADFGTQSEVYQYSGRKYDDNWQCPLNVNHAATNDNSTP